MIIYLFFSMVDALQHSMKSISIQPPNQLLQQQQDTNQDANGERVSVTILKVHMFRPKKVILI